MIVELVYFNKQFYKLRHEESWTVVSKRNVLL